VGAPEAGCLRRPCRACLGIDVQKVLTGDRLFIHNEITGLGYLGVDIVLDKAKAP